MTMSAAHALPLLHSNSPTITVVIEYIYTLLNMGTKTLLAVIKVLGLFTPVVSGLTHYPPGEF